jgi:hypothetical protein
VGNRQKHPGIFLETRRAASSAGFGLAQKSNFRQLLASWYMFFFQLPFLPEFFLKQNDYAALENALRNTTLEKGVFTDADIAAYKNGWREPYALTAMINYYRANILGRFFGKSRRKQKNHRSDGFYLRRARSGDFAGNRQRRRRFCAKICANGCGVFRRARITSARLYGQSENAEFMLALFKSWGYDAQIEQFDVLFPTPKTRASGNDRAERFTANSKNRRSKKTRLRIKKRTASDLQRLFD